MDNIKELVDKLVDKIKGSKDIKELFEKEPIKAVEKVLGVDLPDDIVEKVIESRDRKRYQRSYSSRELNRTIRCSNHYKFTIPSRIGRIQGAKRSAYGRYSTRIRR